MEEQSLMLFTGLEESMHTLKIDKEVDLENESVPVEEVVSLMAGFQLMGE